MKRCIVDSCNTHCDHIHNWPHKGVDMDTMHWQSWVSHHNDKMETIHTKILDIGKLCLSLFAMWKGGLVICQGHPGVT